MNNVLEFSVSELLKNDDEKAYRFALSDFSVKISKLKRWKIANKKNVDDVVKEATKVYMDAILSVDSLLKQADFEKNSGFVTKVIVKTLKVAQKMLATMLIKNPVKVGIAYNAMHNVIKFLEKEMKKK